MYGNTITTRLTRLAARKGSRRALAALAVGAAYCLLPTGAAHAADRLFDGAYCQPQSTADIADVSYGNLGVRNTGSGMANVECPLWLPFNGALTVNSVSVAFYDRNPAANVVCTIRALSIQGTQTSSVVVSSAASGAAVQFGFAPFNLPLLGTMRMSCSIPGPTALGASSVATYRLITTP